MRIILAFFFLAASAIAQAAGCTTVTGSWSMDYTVTAAGFSGVCSSTVTTGCYEHFEFNDTANPIPSKTTSTPIFVATGIVSSQVTVTPITYAAGALITFEVRTCGRDASGSVICGPYAAFPQVTCVPGGITIAKPTPTTITIQ